MQANLGTIEKRVAFMKDDSDELSADASHSVPASRIQTIPLPNTKQSSGGCLKGQANDAPPPS
jgi:hypothetical protein